MKIIFVTYSLTQNTVGAPVSDDLLIKGQTSNDDTSFNFILSSNSIFKRHIMIALMFTRLDFKLKNMSKYEGRD